MTEQTSASVALMPTLQSTELVYKNVVSQFDKKIHEHSVLYFTAAEMIISFLREEPTREHANKPLPAGEVGNTIQDLLQFAGSIASHNVSALYGLPQLESAGVVTSREMTSSTERDEKLQILYAYIENVVAFQFPAPEKTPV